MSKMSIVVKKLLRKTLFLRRKQFAESLTPESTRLLNEKVASRLLQYLSSIPTLGDATTTSLREQETYIAGFIPIRNEINIPSILQLIFQNPNSNYSHLQFCLPVHQRSEFLQPLIFREYSLNSSSPQNGLVNGEYGILVPDDSAKLVTPLVILTPFLGFDPLTRHRIGYGGGHFDRTIYQYKSLASSTHSNNNSQLIQQKFIGVGYDCQRENSIPIDEGDQPLDAIITEKNIYT